jgi:16S rRNA (guanine966-N2)-methyltransferase
MRDTRFQPRDNRFGRPEGKFNPRNNKFQPKKGFFPKGKSNKAWDKDRRPRIVSDMQVTEGKHRGKYLVSTASPKIRPTARRLREIMFRILYRKVRAKRFLDLCAGAGTVGIEAMSRGALLGTFVERSAKMCSFIRKNMATCGIKEGHGEVHEAEVVPFLKQMKKRKRFWDVVYFDPPYDADYDEVLKYLSRGVAIEPGGTLVIEHHAEMFFPEKMGQLKRWRVIVQGDSALSFFERR